jgi:imidazolonepropionase-like amidohydrolase
MSRLATILILMAALGAGAAHADLAGAARAFVGVTVIPMDAPRVIADQTVVVRGGTITAMGPAAAVDAGDAVVIDARGRFLMPGVAEMHAHIPPQPDRAQDTLDTLFLYVANGITLARGMLGAPHHLELRAQAARGEIVAPHIVTSGPSLNGRSVASPEAGRAMVAEQSAAGYDFLKIHPGLDRARYDAIVEAAHEHGIPFAGHVPEAVGLAGALEAGQATIDHLDEYLPALLREGSPLTGTPARFFGWNLAGDADEHRITELARRTRDAGVWNVPTQSLIEQLLLPERTALELLARSEMRFVTRATAEHWARSKADAMADPEYDPALARRFVDIRRRLIKALHDAGAGLLLGSDAPQIFNVPGFSIHEELRLLVVAGLDPWEALATGNVNVARFLGAADAFGQVAVGMRADLVLLERNPLEDVGHFRDPLGVMIAGRWHDRTALAAGLEAIAVRRGAE